MDIYLDTRDLIVLAEKKTSEESKAFEEKLRQNSGRLVYSLHNIIECCGPLIKGGVGSSVMRTLNRLEQMPHLFIADAQIEALELREAVRAFSECREYVPIVPPFVERFDFVVSAFRPPATSIYLQYGLAHTIFELWNTDKRLFAGVATHGNRLRAVLEADRGRSDFKNHESNFLNTIERHLSLYQIVFPIEKVRDLAKWIYATPSRCPAQRLGYEVFHKLLKNIEDSSQDSDLPDFSHVSCVPYVEFATLDKRMRGYIEQVDRSIGSSFSPKLRPSLEEIEQLL